MPNLHYLSCLERCVGFFLCHLHTLLCSTLPIVCLVLSSVCTRGIYPTVLPCVAQLAALLTPATEPTRPAFTPPCSLALQPLLPSPSSVALKQKRHRGITMPPLLQRWHFLWAVLWVQRMHGSAEACKPTPTNPHQPHPHQTHPHPSPTPLLASTWLAREGTDGGVLQCTGSRFHEVRTQPPRR